jgi:hypothetical protein
MLRRLASVILPQVALERVDEYRSFDIPNSQPQPLAALN